MAKLRNIEGITTNSLISGHMYYFKYIAEPENEYYDMFPLIFMTRKKGTLFEGVNFHYMSIPRRNTLYENLQRFLSDKVIDGNTRLRVKAFRELIFRSIPLRDGKIAFHRYQYANIASKILRIEPENWSTAINQKGAELFRRGQGGRMNKKQIWRETKLKSRGIR